METLRRTLDDYLQTVKEGVQRERVRNMLTKTIIASEERTTEAALVERFVRNDARLTFASGIGKKRDGMRLPTKPHWSIFSGDRGFEISRTAALYANFLLDGRYDFVEIETRITAEYERIIEESKPSRVKHGW